MTEIRPPSLVEIKETADAIAPHVIKTPVCRWQGGIVEKLLGSDTSVDLKLELFQRTGSFKARGTIASMLALTPAALELGVTAVSSGNHAIATAYAAKRFDTSAKVVMQKSANPARVALARSFGAEVVIAEDGPTGFAMVEQIVADEGRSFIHPFEGHAVARGSATVGLEMHDQLGELDAVVVSIGGGGLCGGVATALKLLQPQCRVYGVEPEGADVMHRSFAAGSPQTLEKISTIADSLAPPFTAQYAYTLCRQFVDELVRVSDDELCTAMGQLVDEMKLVVEPAGAAATAALLGPLQQQLRGARVGVIICGSNIDLDTFNGYLKK